MVDRIMIKVRNVFSSGACACTLSRPGCYSNILSQQRLMAASPTINPHAASRAMFKLSKCDLQASSSNAATSARRRHAAIDKNHTPKVDLLMKKQVLRYNIQNDVRYIEQMVSGPAFENTQKQTMRKPVIYSMSSACAAVLYRWVGH